MTSLQWLALLRALPAAIADYRVNTPPPAALAGSGGGFLVTLEAIDKDLPEANAWLGAHPGAVTGLARLCAAVAAAGSVNAARVRNVVLAAPDALLEAEKDLATAVAVLKEFQPAPVGIPGAWEGARGHV